jgi:hypothetical protein
MGYWPALPLVSSVMPCAFVEEPAPLLSQPLSCGSAVFSKLLSAAGVVAYFA